MSEPRQSDRPKDLQTRRVTPTHCASMDPEHDGYLKFLEPDTRERFLAFRVNPGDRTKDGRTREHRQAPEIMTPYENEDYRGQEDPELYADDPDPDEEDPDYI
jgi:hypothetical protein